MYSRNVRAVAAAMLATLTLVPRAFAGDHAPVFDKRPYEEAKKAAETDKKWFVVKATASWCAPCQMMDKSTWRDEKVVDWFKKNGVAVVFDVDKDKKLYKDLAIQAMPTMIAFKDGKEFDRVVGYKSPDEFLGWLEGIARGEKSIEATRKKAGKRDGKTVDVQSRLQLARELRSSGKFDEATDEYIWLWEHMLEHQQSMYGVRLSFMVSDMQQLARQNEAAKKKFTAVRDETEKVLEDEKVDVDDVVDWIALNKIVGQPGDTLRWFDKVKDQKRWRPIINRVARDIEELLIARDRWEDIGRLYADPMAEFEREKEMQEMHEKMPMPKLSAAQRKELQEMTRQSFREKFGRMYAGLLAADRDKEAAQIAEATRGLDKSPEMLEALVATALTAEEPRPEHVAWLKAAEEKDESLVKLRKRAEAALKAEK